MYQSETDSEASMSNTEINQLVRKYEKLLQIDEYIGTYSSSSEDEPRTNLNVEIKEDQLDEGEFEEIPPRRYTDTQGYMTPEEEMADEYYNPNADRYFGTSNDFERPIDIPNINMPVFPMRGKRKVKTRKTMRYNPRIPRDYIPTDNPRDYNDSNLNLNCLRHPEREIDGWIRKMHILVQTNQDAFTKVETLRAYLDFYMEGNVRNWFNTSPYISSVVDPTFDPSNPNVYIDQLGRLLYNEFCGFTELNHKEAVAEASAQKARYILEQISICNICYWKQYVCEFEKWYYELPYEERSSMDQRFFNKLPPVWAEEMNKKWKQRPPHITEGLAGRVRLLQESIEEKCKSTYKDNSLKPYYQNKPCCDPALLDIPNKWGCRNYSSKKKTYTKSYQRPRYRKKYRRFKPRYRKYKGIPDQNRPRYKRRKFRKPSKKETCPRGKAKCQCWLCKEEGHYANECPKRTSNKDQVKILERLYRLDFEPVESDTDATVYELDIQYEYQTFSSDPGEDWESYSDSDQEWKDF